MPPSDIVEIEPDDYYLSEMLGQYVYTFKCPKCATWGFVSQLGDISQCGSCGSFFRVVKKENPQHQP